MQRRPSPIPPRILPAAHSLRKPPAFDLRQPAIVDNFLEEVLGEIFGRFLETHRPWRWRPGTFFGGRGAFGKMGKREF
jgi:hypothetical protein